MPLVRSVAAIVAPRTGTRPGSPAPAARAATDTTPEDGSLLVAARHIRRCTYRRVTAVPMGRRELPLYEVDCLHPVYDAAVRLGDLPAAYDACAACTLPGRFRPDEE